jgi:hypothetical protein
MLETKSPRIGMIFIPEGERPNFYARWECAECGAGFSLPTATCRHFRYVSPQEAYDAAAPGDTIIINRDGSTPPTENTIVVTGLLSGSIQVSDRALPGSMATLLIKGSDC